ncbi:MAG TPA: GH1 family beta-glucosidase [Burkholderiales bacterium]|nr:GH1 family beta-glucosidase [Burkholderiales bacterium]
MLRFPDGFVWGTSTASAQIEGAAEEDGKGESIWDRFARDPSRIADGETPATTCDHYHRYRDDLDLMRALGLRAYRFSIAWPRILPTGTGAVNSAGLAFYDRLVDAMLERGIRPFATLFHWDLPQAMQDRGGWANRATIDAYLYYAETVVRRLGDRIKDWMTHNEPWVYSFCGHLYGVHAPGVRDLRTALATAHHLLVSHGCALPLIRATCSGARVGIVNNLEWIEPASDRPEDVAAAMRWDGAFVRWFHDPLFGRGYPGDLLAWYGALAPRIEPGDFDVMAAPADFLGVNYYTRRVIAHDPAGRDASERTFLAAKQIYWPFVPRAEFDEWEVAPEGMYRTLLRLQRDYAPASLYVTENGTTWPDRPGSDGTIHDLLRIRYVARHTAAVHQAIRDGAAVRGYFLWSLIDNYEWGFGFTKRFGIVHVDHATQRRTVKDSGSWYRRVVRENAVPLADSNATL